MSCQSDSMGNQTCTTIAPDPALVNESYCLSPSLKRWVQSHGVLPDEAIAGEGIPSHSEQVRGGMGGADVDGDAGGCSAVGVSPGGAAGSTGLVALLLGGLFGTRRRRRA